MVSPRILFWYEPIRRQLSYHINPRSGDELYNYLLHHGAIPVEKVQKIFTQLVGAVSYVHNMSCVHRDLKLENILLDRNENVKLCDFGFTREYEAKIAHLQTYCGTVCYSAPEMLKGEKYTGEKVDVWSLGIILYSLLTGELPFDDDDDVVTKHKILSSEPTYPENLPIEAKALISLMLSKRQLLRPGLADILTNSFLAGHAPQQQAILKLTRPLPFTTSLEKETLERMRSAGVDIDRVIENVLAQRCDALAGWWALLIEKEERKEKRREKKRREREIEVKNLRRLSGASNFMERIAAPLNEVEEENLLTPVADNHRDRGRRERRSMPTRKSHERSKSASTEFHVVQLVLPELPKLPESMSLDSPTSPIPPPPLQKDHERTRSMRSSRRRPPLPPKEARRQRRSTLQLASTNPSLLTPPNGVSQGRPARKHPHGFFNQLATIKHWFVESAKRAKSPASKSDLSTLKTSPPLRGDPVEVRRATNSMAPNHPAINPIREIPGTSHSQPRIPKPSKRSSLSPTPVTPRATYRRTSGGLRGRKSTSSSVSSIRSIHHLPTHSKASSTSSTSNSVQSSVPFSKKSKSPHPSVKALPSTPVIASFPSNIRLVRAAPNYNESANFGSPNGTVFAKRKKTPFRGPMLSLGTNGGTTPNGRPRDSSVGGSRSASAVGRASGEIIKEEDEDDVEEVDAFSPAALEAEDMIGEGENDGWIRRRHE